jgi:hypothetical protein
MIPTAELKALLADADAECEAAREDREPWIDAVIHSNPKTIEGAVAGLSKAQAAYDEACGRWLEVHGQLNARPRWVTIH